MDVEHLFDGRTLVFYFLGEVTSELEALTAELAELYETHVQFRRFGQALDEGCGPGCGSEAAEGCKTCATGCAIASACSTRAITADRLPAADVQLRRSIWLPSRWTIVSVRSRLVTTTSRPPSGTA